MPIKRPIDAINAWAKQFVKNMPLDRIQEQICDDIATRIWMEAPWRWTLSAGLSAVTITADTQDYAITVPSDFLKLHEAYIADGSTTPRPLEIVAALPANVKVVGQPSQISVSGSPGGAGVIRTHPKTAPTLGFTQQIIMLYKKKITPITNANIADAGALVMPDEWFPTFKSGVLWLAYLFSDDQRAGGAQMQGPNAVFTGQRAIFEADLQRMRMLEMLPLEDKVEGKNGRR